MRKDFGSPPDFRTLYGLKWARSVEKRHGLPISEARRCSACANPFAYPAVEKFCRASSAGGRLNLQTNSFNRILSVAEDCLSPAGSFHGCSLMHGLKSGSYRFWQRTDSPPGSNMLRLAYADSGSACKLAGVQIIPLPTVANQILARTLYRFRRASVCVSSRWKILPDEFRRPPDGACNKI